MSPPPHRRARSREARIENYPQERKRNARRPTIPQKPELGRRKLPLSRELWIEREDFSENPPKGYFPPLPGNKVRLRYGLCRRVHGLRPGDGHRALPPTTRTRNRARRARRRSR